MKDFQNEPRIWKLIHHTILGGEIDSMESYYQITDGKISIISYDDDKQALKGVVEALNASDCSFFQDYTLEIENKMLRDDVEYLKELVIKMGTK
jgi:hypothetical protein